MMKRSGTNGTVHDFPVPQSEHYISVSKTPEATKVVWHVDPGALVGPREEEARRKSPEGKVLYAVSALLTIMVLWGVFKQVHYIIPQIFSSNSAAVSLEQIQSDAASFNGLNSDLDIGGRKTAKHLLEVALPEQSQAVVRPSWRRVFRPLKGRNPNEEPQQEHPYQTGRGGNFVLRRRGST